MTSELEDVRLSSAKKEGLISDVQIVIHTSQGIARRIISRLIQSLLS